MNSFWAEYKKVFEIAAQDPEVRVVMISSNARIFTAGLDSALFLLVVLVISVDVVAGVSNTPNIIMYSSFRWCRWFQRRN